MAVLLEERGDENGRRYAAVVQSSSNAKMRLLGQKASSNARSMG
jgi:hypothetical protein